MSLQHGAQYLEVRQWQEARWSRLPDRFKARMMWPEGKPKDAWHSFDRQPWKHPWLTPSNIRSFRTFSDDWLAVLKVLFDARDDTSKRYAFVGNMANNLYVRAKALAHRDLSIDTYLHPHDNFLMSQPAWEEYDGDVPEGVSTLAAACAAGVQLPVVPAIYSHGTVSWTSITANDLVGSMRYMDLKRFPDYFAYFPTLQELQKYDALLGVQVPYLAYLSGRPYAVTQMGGDIWYECSRDDLYGRLQRLAFQKAEAFIVSNPWSLAFARRYGMRNMIYLPFLIDENKYSPGHAQYRNEWVAQTGGDFFVMMSSRLDYVFKGSDLAIKAFARFAQQVPGARLVIAGWGADQARAEKLFDDLGIANKVLVVPVAGKKKLVGYLRSADCMVDQLTLGYYGASALEAMACGLPVIMNLNHEQYDALLPEGCAPVCQAVTEDEVLAHLLNLAANASRRLVVGARLRSWFLQTHSNARWGEMYEAVLWGTATRQLPAFRTSPLAAAVGKDEFKYHAKELKSAPQFPSYV